MRILHASDFHIQESTAYHIGERIKALTSELLPKPPQCVVLSGDLAHGGQKDQYKLFHKHVVEPLVSAFSLSPADIFITP